MTTTARPLVRAPGEGLARHKRSTLASISDGRSGIASRKSLKRCTSLAWHKVPGACYGCALVRRPPPYRALAFAIVGASCLALLLPGLGGATSGSSFRQKASALQSQNASLAAQSRSAVVQMYALERLQLKSPRMVLGPTRPRMHHRFQTRKTKLKNRGFPVWHWYSGSSP